MQTPPLSTAQQQPPPQDDDQVQSAPQTDDNNDNDDAEEKTEADGSASISTALRGQGLFLAILCNVVAMMAAPAVWGV